MTITVGAFEAKTHLSTLLDRVGEGEEVIIIKHGKPVVRLVSAARVDRARVNEAFEKLKLLRKRTGVPVAAWFDGLPQRRHLVSFDGCRQLSAVAARARGASGPMTAPDNPSDPLFGQTATQFLRGMRTLS